MNMYEVIRRRFLNAEMTPDDVMRCAQEKILSFTEAKQIIELNKNVTDGKGGGADDEE
jgi:hypothetical protein